MHFRHFTCELMAVGHTVINQLPEYVHRLRGFTPNADFTCRHVGENDAPLVGQNFILCIP